MAYIQFEKKEFNLMLFLLTTVFILMFLGGYMLGEINGEGVMSKKVSDAIDSDNSGFCKDVCKGTLSTAIYLDTDEFK